MRLERFVELRRSAWLSTTIFSPPPAKDVSTVPSTVAEPISGNVEIEENGPLGNEVFPSVHQIPCNSSSSDNNGGIIETDGSGIKWRYATQGELLAGAIESATQYTRVTLTDIYPRNAAAGGKHPK